VIKVRVAINGFGRIGRAFFKIALEKGINVVAINDLTDTKTLAYLLKYDSVYGNYNKKISFGDNFLKVGDKKVEVFAKDNPISLPWKKLKVDVVIESTGFFCNRYDAEKHLWAGAKKVIITAPAKEPDITVVLGVNDNKLKKSHKIISMASCTTNCFAPLVKVLNDNFKIKNGFLTTIHAYTNDQKILDAPHKKLRRGRSAAVSIIPTSSGVTEAISEVIPSLKGKVDGLAMRVPVQVGSIVDFVCNVQKKVDVNKINNAMKKAAKGKLKGILEYSEDELVSADVIRNPASSVFDSLSTQVINGDLIKVLSWYDNEFGYSNRLVDLVKKLR